MRPLPEMSNSMLSSCGELEIVPLSEKILEKLLFRKIMDRISPEEMSDIGKEMDPRGVKETLIFLDMKTGLDALVSGCFEKMALSSGQYQLNSVRKGDNYRLVFRHEYGPKWSSFLKSYVSEIIKSVAGIEPKVRIEGGLVIFTC